MAVAVIKRRESGLPMGGTKLIHLLLDGEHLCANLLLEFHILRGQHGGHCSTLLVSGPATSILCIAGKSSFQQLAGPPAACAG